MSDKTKIQWTATVNPDGSVTPGSTWNPVRGCSRVSEGCRNCYAEGVAARFSAPGLAYAGLARQSDHGPRWTGKVVMVPEHLDDPIRWKRPRRIFVNSMSDLFQEKLPDADIERVFHVMLAAPRHTYQVLTKRAERMQRFVDAFCAERGWKVLPPFIHLGVSTEDQANADERVPALLATPAAVRFVSAEPLLGPINLAPWMWAGEEDDRPVVNWVIVGGESGHNARSFDVQWARDIVSDCAFAGAAAFVKQLGGKPYDSAKRWAPLGPYPSHGPDIAEWDADFAVREFPEVATAAA